MPDVIEKPALNGVNTPTLLATINAVGAQPELADFKFRARASWVSGNHSRIVVDDFFGAGQELRHEVPTVVDADHPTVLVGDDNGPTPVEFLLQGLAACLTAGIGNIAAVRGVKLSSVESVVEGDINLLGLLGLNPRCATAIPASAPASGSAATPRPRSFRDRRAEPGPLRRLRRADERRAGDDRDRRRLTPPGAGSARRPPPCHESETMRLPGDGFETSTAEIELAAVRGGFETIGRRTVIPALPRRARWRAGKPA